MRFSFSFQSTFSLNFFYVLLMFNFCADLHSIIITTLLQETNFSEYKNYKYKLSCQNLDLLYFYVRILTVFFPMFPFDSTKNIGKTRVFCRNIAMKRVDVGLYKNLCWLPYQINQRYSKVAKNEIYRVLNKGIFVGQLSLRLLSPEAGKRHAFIENTKMKCLFILTCFLYFFYFKRLLNLNYLWRGL